MYWNLYINTYDVRILPCRNLHIIICTYTYFSGIRKDLGNGPFHRLGDHTNCETYFCNGSKINELNLVPEAVDGGIMSEIQNCVSRLITNAES